MRADTQKGGGKPRREVLMTQNDQLFFTLEY